MITVTAAAEELFALIPPPGARRWVLGISGAPGAGKSTLAAHLAALLGDRAAHVPMDGFHLADVELDRQGLRDRKGASPTFDPAGCAAMLERVRHRREETVYAPAFDRTLEQPLAGAIAVLPVADVVLIEGNYLLLDAPLWRRVHDQLDEVWHVGVEESLRRDRLVARHVAFGKSPDEARRWVAAVDEPNARLVEAAAHRADRVLDLTLWSGQ